MIKTWGSGPPCFKPSFINVGSHISARNGNSVVQLKKLCPTLCDSMNCSQPGFYVRGISQARILE